MNQSKLKYARERLNTIRHQKQDAVPSEPSEDELEWDDALKRLRNGVATVNWNLIGKTRDRWGHSRGLHDDIMRQVVGKDNAVINKRNKAAVNRRAKAQGKIRVAAQAVEDELVLGDEAKALALLDKFAAS